MTGHGTARGQEAGIEVSVELRSVNNRHFKLQLRCEGLHARYESRIESLIKSRIRRGAVFATIRIVCPASDEMFRIRADVISAYRRQLHSQFGPEADSVPLWQLLALPGVIPESDDEVTISEPQFDAILAVVAAACDDLQAMRLAEGDAMRSDLLGNCRAIRGELERIRELAPEVIANYRDRLLERVQHWVRAAEAQIAPADIVRDVAIVADRCDISEEIVRLGSHLDQFASCLDESEPVGRKLDFLTQELFREANTIGSKANHASIAQRVVEIKNRIERIREMVQNVE